MNFWVKQLFFILLILAFTPLAFTLMPLIVIAAVIGGIYMMIVTNKKHHQLH